MQCELPENLHFRGPFEIESNIRFRYAPPHHVHINLRKRERISFITGFPDILSGVAISTPILESDYMVASARFFRVLGDPTRLKILELLLVGPHSVSELVEAIGASQARISNHLACLRWCRFVEAEREGRTAIYRIIDPRITTLLESGREFANEHSEHLIACKRIGPDWI